tara:strand:- start:812 stop:1465 length:654 start_codon:yes stop_codon:yes gene_type:complete
MVKELEISEYKEYLNKFYVLDIGIKGKIKKGKDVNGNYIYISNDEKFILYPPEYTNTKKFKQVIEKKNELLRKVNLLINDTIINNNVEEENNKLYKAYIDELNKILQYENIFNENNENISADLRNEIKDLQQERNILENELQAIYENKISLYKSDSVEWSKQNKTYLTKLNKINKIKEALGKKEIKILENIKNESIIIKKPSVEFNPKDYNINIIMK